MKLFRLTRTWALCACLATTAQAEVVSVSFHELVNSSDAIVLAQVIQVRGQPGDPRQAILRVIEVWKWSPRNQVTIDVSQSWSCDISDAVVGELVVLFLEDGHAPAPPRIAFSGRGRWPVIDISWTPYVAVGRDVVVPKLLVVRTDEKLGALVRLDELRTEITRLKDVPLPLPKP